MARSRERLSLPLAGEAEPEIHLYTGHIDGRLVEDLRTVGRHFLAARIFPVSYPKKLPCPAWGISATRCRMGSVLATVEGSVCHPSVCYAKRGRFTFDNVTDKMDDAWEWLHHPLWVPAAIHMITWTTPDYWRWFHS